MRQPTVAIIGRPNVGKSTLVNRLVGGRKAIVDDIPGVTRDRAYYEAEWIGRSFTVIDTGGLEPDEEQDLFQTKIKEQVDVALVEADAVVFLVDGVSDITQVDEIIAKQLRSYDKPVFLTVNKIDSQVQMAYVAEFYKLGLGEPYPVSAMQGTVGVGDLLDAVVNTFKEKGFWSDEEEPEEEGTIRLAFVGRPNVGKSSMVNQLLGKMRTIVSDIPGTTRDAIDTKMVWEDQPFILVDTAGIRKKSKVAYGPEMFSVNRALEAMKRSDVSVLVLDAEEGVTDQDKKIIEQSNEYGCGLIIAMNKWDLIEEKATNIRKEKEKEIYHMLPHASFAPLVFTSAKTGQRVDSVLKHVIEVQQNRQRRIQTSIINQLLMDAYAMQSPPSVKNKRLKIYYGTQVSTAPPTFLLFVNNQKLLKETYRRYLERYLRENIEFSGTPLFIRCRNKQEK